MSTFEEDMLKYNAEKQAASGKAWMEQKSEIDNRRLTADELAELAKRVYSMRLSACAIVAHYYDEPEEIEPWRLALAFELGDRCFRVGRLLHRIEGNVKQKYTDHPRQLTLMRSQASNELSVMAAIVERLQ